MNSMSDNTTEMYRKKLKKYDSVSFICFDKKQYENFKLKDEYPVIYVDNLYDFAVKINSCKLFVGNQSAPMALAVALNVPRYTELYGKIDHIHYMKDIVYYQNYDYFIGDNY
jgi:ADP-heptose:LPS heptosyltransferase